MTKYIFSLILLPLMVLISLTGCAQKTEIPPEPLRFGMVQWIGYAPFYVADAEKQLPSSLKVIDFLSNSDLVESIKNGQIDAAFLTLDEVMRLEKDRIPLTIFLIADESTGADAIMAAPDIHAIPNLKGKKVGYELGSVQEYLLSRALEINHMQWSDIQPVLVKIDQQGYYWKQHRFDAVTTYEPHKSLLESLGMHSIFDSRQIPGEIIDVMAVKTDKLASYRPTLQAISTAWFEAYPHVKDHTHSLAQVLQTDPKIIHKQLAGIQLGDLNLNHTLLAPGALTPAAKHIVHFLKLPESLVTKVKTTTEFLSQ